MNKFVEQVLRKISYIPKTEDGEPGKLYFNVQVFDAGRFVYAKTGRDSILFGYLTDKKRGQKTCEIDIGSTYGTALRVNTYSGTKIKTTADILERFEVLHRNLGQFSKIVRDDVLEIVRKLYTVGETDKVSIINLLSAGNKNDQVCLDQLNLLSQSYNAPVPTLEKQVFLGIVLTDNPSTNRMQKKKQWLYQLYKEDVYLKDENQWCNKLYEALFVHEKYGKHHTFEAMKKAFFDAHPLERSKTFVNPLYPKEFWWYKLVGHHYTKKIKKLFKYGYVYEVVKDGSRDFTCFVPEAYLILTQPMVSPAHYPFKKGSYMSFPGQGSSNYRYEVQGLGAGRFTSVKTLDGYTSETFSAYFQEPLGKSDNYYESLSEDNRGLSLFQPVEVPDRGICIVTAITKNGKIVVFDGRESFETEHYKKTKDNKFETGAIVACPYTEMPFDFGTVVYRRGFTVNKMMLWEYAVKITEKNSDGVFYYPEALLIARPQEKVEVEVPKKELQVAKKTTLVSAMVKQKRRLAADKIALRINQYGDSMQKNLQYATGATLLILLYALI